MPVQFCCLSVHICMCYDDWMPSYLTSDKQRPLQTILNKAVTVWTLFFFSMLTLSFTLNWWVCSLGFTARKMKSKGSIFSHFVKLFLKMTKAAATKQRLRITAEYILWFEHDFRIRRYFTFCNIGNLKKLLVSCPIVCRRSPKKDGFTTCY